MLQYPGIFISVDGPNAVGKGTFIELLCGKLNTVCTTVLTREPTLTSLGQFAKKNEGNLTGLPYAYLIAADRCYHIEKEVLPHIKQGEIVISDRYVESSFVYQRFDGLTFEKIWDLNNCFPIPHLSILLLADENILSERLCKRLHLSDFEIRMTRIEEKDYYINAKTFLESRGFNYLVLLNNTQDNLEENVQSAFSKILSIYRGESDEKQI